MYQSKVKKNARTLRKNSTDAESHLWFHLRANRLGYKFKRQVPLGAYIVDFACFEKKLIIELDGGHHMSQQDYDLKRTAWLNAEGFKVIRFWNVDVFQHTRSVLEGIMMALSGQVALSPTLSRSSVAKYSAVGGRGGKKNVFPSWYRFRNPYLASSSNIAS